MFPLSEINQDVQHDNDSSKVYCNLICQNESCVHACKAEVLSNLLNGALLPQSIVTNPVELTVANTTKLFLNVTRPDASSTVHHFFGNVTYMFNGSGASGVFNKPVNVTINQTLYYYQGKTDNQTGGFSFDVDLKPVGNAATPYEVLASFEDNAQAINCTAWSKTPDGQDHAACTTVQYGYKPATKSLTLEVPCLCDRLSLSEA